MVLLFYHQKTQGEGEEDGNLKPFERTFCSMGSCVDGLSSLISSKRSRGENESLKEKQPGDRPKKFLDEVLDELRWGIKT